MRYAAIAMVLAILLSGSSDAASAQVVESSVLERNCDAGDQDACVDFGHRLLFSQFGDTVRAVSLLERACDAGKLEGCFKLGENFRYRNDASRARAVPLFQKACDGAHGDACASLGWLYMSGRGIGRDDARAAALSERACNLRSLSGCNQGAGWHNPLTGVLKDATRWAAYLEKLCDAHAQPRSCLQLGLAYDIGMWVPKNADHANELFKKSCLHGINEGVNEGCAMMRK